MVSQEEAGFLSQSQPQDLPLELELEVTPNRACSSPDVSPNSSIDGGGKFLKCPTFNQLFTVSPGTKKRRESTCNACTKRFKTNELLRLVTHTRKCPHITEGARDQLVFDYYTAMEPGSSSRDILLTKMFVENNYSLRSVESLSFKKFTQSLCPSYSPPTRRLLSEVYIPKLSKESETAFKKFWGKKDHALSLEFDHWSDANRKSLFGIVATNVDGAKYLCSLTDASLEGHSTICIVKALKDGLTVVPKQAINAFVSDSASSCKNAREHLVQDPHYSHVLQHRCIAHLMNRIGWHFAKNADIEKALRWATMVSSFVSASTKVQALLRERGINQVTRATHTRWYSTANMIASLLDAKNVIVEAASSLSEAEQRAVIVDEVNWMAIKCLTKIFFPLAKCIGVTERKNSSMGEAVEAMLKLGRFLYEQEWDNPLIEAAVRSYLSYFSARKLGDKEFGLIIGAYVLDRRYKLDYLTEDALDMALSAILEVATKSGINLVTAKRKLIPEFNSYCRFEGDYRTDASNESAASWWSKRCDSGSIQRVALRFAYLKSSSANIERTFSALKYVQGSWRLNLSLDSMRDITRLRFSDSSGMDDLIDGFNENLVIEDSPTDEDNLQDSVVLLDQDLARRAEILGDGQIIQLLSNFNRLFNFSKITKIRAQEEIVEQPRVEDLLRESRIDRQVWSQISPNNDLECNSGRSRNIEDNDEQLCNSGTNGSYLTQ